MRPLAFLLLTALLLGPAVAGADEPAFDLWEVAVEGNTVLSVEAIERAVQPHLGPGRSMKDVEAARAALEAAYQQAGYLTVLVDIPEQRVDEGVVRLSVLQGRLGQVWVTGSRYHAQGHIRAALPSATPGEVPNFTTLQQELAEVNRSDARRVQPVIKPGRLPGTVDLDLQVSDQLPLSGSIEVNNQHAAGTTPLRLSGTLRYDNLLQRDHSLSLTLQTAPEKPEESRVAVLNYSLPGGQGDLWALSFTDSNSNVETLGGTQALGKGRTLGLRYHHPIGQGGWSGTLSAGADLKHLRDTISASSSALETPLRYLPFQLAYAGQWSEGRQSLQLSTQLTVAWGRLLQRRLLCAGIAWQDQFDCKTQGASGSFGVWRIDGRWLQPGWFDGLWSARLLAQVASGPLVSAEQLTLGGQDNLRGYPDSEVAADHALAASLEWRSSNLAEAIGTGWTEVRPLVFADAARGLLAQPGSGQAPRTSLLSVGLGLRMAGAGLEAALDLGWPLRASAHAELHDPRLHLRVLTRY
ncbi:ShlB/FhaC/HecB family hemolysin secretion/activation protein [Ideonella alba]|uniref:ShlB/FhaC/HecB family hemolysin secretion/activation protein n=1 Tax=Ideonella alba TaxID=2824118 RepID=A0A940Y776_9BURK|nr:ShlB/FhaC/HecB family hemolysin secretion/activation protein [Ideonella alba]MBQ0928943.1 ShlB/FhaC/HecB family hemolysin secretion/activation protein [Ideonella alba]